MARQWAQSEYGVELLEVHADKRGPKGLPFLAATGCTVAPHLRPLCTLHTCQVNSFGYKVGDQAWTDKYFTLRQRIDEAEWERHKEKKP